MARVLEPVSGLPGGALVALRYLGATHRLALMGSAPALAARYPSCGGDGSAAQAWPALLELTEQAAGVIVPLLERGVQTNEVGRSGALLGGFLLVARRHRLPLRLLEVGASAGLNLRWDRFSYAGWGPPSSPVDLGDPWIGAARPDLTPPEVEVADREGCDLAPVDPTSEDGRLTLLSFVWPDMTRRFDLLREACRVAADVPATVTAASADEWAAERLAGDGEGMATVVYHSVVLQYIERAARDRLLDEITAAGRRATRRAPLAWLRLEPPGRLGSPDFEVRLTTWPGAEDRRLAVAHPHGTWVRWAA